MALALDGPRRHDRTIEAGGLRFLLDRRLLSNLTRFMPFEVDHDPDRWWQPFVVTPGWSR